MRVAIAQQFIITVYLLSLCQGSLTKLRSSRNKYYDPEGVRTSSKMKTRNIQEESLTLTTEFPLDGNNLISQAGNMFDLVV